MADLFQLLVLPVITGNQYLTSGTVDFYYPGTTGEDNRKAVYTSAAGTTEAANPYTLDGTNANATLYGVGLYHIIIKDEDGTTIYDFDNVAPQQSDLSGVIKSVTSDYGAVGDGVTDDSTAFSDAYAASVANNYTILVPPGSYLSGGTVYTVESPFFWYNEELDTAVNIASQAQSGIILLTAQTSDAAVQDSAYSRVPLNVTVRARGAQHASGVRSNLTNSSTDGNGCTAFYASTVSDVDANWSAGLHSESKHGGGTTICLNLEAASFETTGTFYGAVVNNTSFTAGATHPVTGGAKVAHPTATGVYVLGVNDDDPMGAWLRGIHISQHAIRTAESGSVGIRLDCSGQYGLWMLTSSINTVADILLAGDSAAGLICNGAYTTGNAIRLADDQALAFNTAGTVKMKFVAADSVVGIYSGASQRFAFDYAATPVLKLNATQVLTTRRTGWTAATGTATRTTFDTASVTTAQLAERFKALTDDLIAHGLIGT